MDRTIHVAMPANLTDEDRSLFETENTYLLRPLKTELIHDVFVTNSGICLKDFTLVKESIHGYENKLDGFYGEAVAAYKAAHASNPKKLIYLNDSNTYLLIHNPWFNYYHWITESLQRLWMVKDESHKFILVLPDYYKNFAGIRESLEPFTFKDIFYIPNDCHVQIKNALVPQLKPICANYYPEIVNEIRAFYVDYVSKNTSYHFALGDKIYISRAGSARRKVANEEAAIALLTRYKFQTIEAERYSFFEQVAIFSKARYLASIHGAGLTNMNFMQQGTSALELHKKKTNEGDHHSLVYWNLASVLGIRYYHQLCNPVHEADDFYTADLVFDIDVLEKNIDQMIAESS